jgi:hypothetical protein
MISARAGATRGILRLPNLSDRRAGA